MVGTVEVPIQAQFKTIWEDDVKGQVQCEVFHLLFSLSWMIGDFKRIAIDFVAKTIFEEGKLCFYERMSGLK